MTQDVFVVAYEGGDTQVVDYAIQRAQKEGAALFIAHILEWSPYSFLTQEELEERHKRRQEELTRAKTAILDPILKHVQDQNVTVDGEIRYGNTAELVIKMAEEQAAKMIFVGRSGSDSLGTRVFGSVSIALAQAAPIPTVIIP